MFKIQDILEEAKENNTNVYFVCDAAQVSEKISNYLKFIRTAENSVEVLSMFSGTEWGNAPLDCSPLLFDFKLCKKDEEFLTIEELLNFSESMHRVMTNISTIEFIKKMKFFLNIEIEGEGSFLFRWYDPRILKLTNALFQNIQKSEFYSGLKSWGIFVRSEDIDFKSKKIMMWG